MHAACTAGIDLLIVMDASKSIGAPNFATSRDFVANMVTNFNIGPSSTRIGVITFSSFVLDQIPLGSIADSQILTQAIKNISYHTIGGTATHIALRYAMSVLQNSSRLDKGIPRVVVLLTDGRSKSPDMTAIAAEQVHDEGIQVYSFGVGSNTDQIELETIASELNYVYHIDDFAADSFATELRPLQISACTSMFNNFLIYSTYMH